MWHLFLLENPFGKHFPNPEQELGSLRESHSFHFIFYPLLRGESRWGWCHAVSKGPLLHWRARTASKTPQGTSRLRAFLSVWLQEGSEALVVLGRPSLGMGAGQGPGEGGRGLREETASEIPLESGKHLRFWGWEGCASPSVLLGLGRVVLPLAGVPQQQGDPDGGESHDPEGCPVQLWKTTRPCLDEGEDQEGGGQ